MRQLFLTRSHIVRILSRTGGIVPRKWYFQMHLRNYEQQLMSDVFLWLYKDRVYSQLSLVIIGYLNTIAHLPVTQSCRIGMNTSREFIN